MEFSYAVGGNVKWCSLSGNHFRRYLKKLKIELPYGPAIPLLDMQENGKHKFTENLVHEFS